MGSTYFTNDEYQRHNRRRQEHLASLALPLVNKTVLEVGAGIGDHTSFFLDRQCRVTVTDARDENLNCVRSRFPSVESRVIDLEKDTPSDLLPHDIVYAYGVIYHLSEPGHTLARIADLTAEILLIETCVSFGAHEAVNPIFENTVDPTQAAHGIGCRPTRLWLFNALKRLLPYVYVPLTQPWHEEFPTDWLGEPPANGTGLYRSIFVASRQPLNNPLLADELIDKQFRR